MELQLPSIPLSYSIKTYIFGSASSKEDANDIDILFVYDERVISPSLIYHHIKEYCLEFGEINDRLVHAVVLSTAEEASVGFLDEIEAKIVQHNCL